MVRQEKWEADIEQLAPAVDWTPITVVSYGGPPWLELAFLIIECLIRAKVTTHYYFGLILGVC